MTLALTLHEVSNGPVSPAKGVELLDGPGLKCSISVAMVALSLVAALSANMVKAPVEKSMLTHLLWIRQYIEKRIIHMYWEDTRDMSADGLTKGTISREALRQLASGIRKIAHATKPVVINRSCAVTDKFDPTNSDRNSPYAHVIIVGDKDNEEILSVLISATIHEKCPDKIGQIDELIAKYRERENLSHYYLALTREYGVVQRYRHYKVHAILWHPPKGFVPGGTDNKSLGKACRECGMVTDPIHLGNECPFRRARPTIRQANKRTTTDTTTNDSTTTNTYNKRQRAASTNDTTTTNTYNKRQQAASDWAQGGFNAEQVGGSSSSGSCGAGAYGQPQTAPTVAQQQLQRRGTADQRRKRPGPPTAKRGCSETPPWKRHKPVAMQSTERRDRNPCVQLTARRDRAPSVPRLPRGSAGLEIASARGGCKEDQQEIKTENCEKRVHCTPKAKSETEDSDMD